MNWQQPWAMVGCQSWPRTRIDWPAQAKAAREAAANLADMWSRQKVYVYEDSKGWIGSLYVDGESRRWLPNPEHPLRRGRGRVAWRL